MKLLFIGLCLFALTVGVALYAQAITSQTQKLVVILLGPPGSGKGTQALRLTKELGIPHISTGDLFRDNLSRNTDLGKRARGYMESGKLVPDDIVLEMLFDRVSRPDCAKGYLLDGFPRTIPQAEALDKHLDKDTKVVALNLEVRDETIMQRMAGRLTCKKAGHVYNRFFSPPKQEGICDQCGGELVQRPDDAPAVVTERLKGYHEQSKPLIKFYEAKGILFSVNGELPADAIFKELVDDIKK